jgi:hypothetical protein
MVILGPVTTAGAEGATGLTEGSAGFGAFEATVTTAEVPVALPSKTVFSSVFFRKSRPSAGRSQDARASTAASDEQAAAQTGNGFFIRLGTQRSLGRFRSLRVGTRAFLRFQHFP